MKIILLILLLPLAKCAFPRISFSCFLLGNVGCEIKCNLKCLLLGCVPVGGICDGWSHCKCHEVYGAGQTTLTNDDFENLDFVELWNRIFEANDASAKVLKRVKSDDQLEIFLIKLLRDTYMTGDDIIALLKKEYPTWKIVNSLVSLQHGWKTEIMEPGKHIQYDELEANMDKLWDLIKTVPPDDLDNSQYKLRVKNFLRKITNIEDLNEILYLVKLSDNKNLLRLVKSSLKNLGYGFEEDENDPDGKITILKNVSVNLEDADDDEKLELAIAKKFMPNKKSTSDSSTKQRIFQANDIDNVFSQGQTYVSKGNDKKLVTNSNTLNPSPEPPVYMLYGGENYTPTAASKVLENSYQNSIEYDGLSGNSAAQYQAYGNSVYSRGQQIDTNNPASKVFVLVVDTNGNVVQASEMPKKPELYSPYTPQWIV